MLLATRGLTVELGRLPSTGELAEHLQLKPHSATELIDRAARNGLVARHVDEDDRRRSLVGVTRQGSEMLDAISRPHRDELRRLRHEVQQHLGGLDDREVTT